jgi:beta-galactosidase
LKTTAPWGLLPEGHVLASEQFSLPTLAGDQGEFIAGRHPVQTISENDTSVSIGNGQSHIVFSKVHGTVDSWRYHDVELIVRGPQPNFRRAPTDNDIGNGMPKRCQVWFDASEKRELVKAEVKKVSEQEAMVTMQFAFPESTAMETVMYRVNADGKLTVNATLKPLKEKLPELPRFGMNMQINQEFSKVTWYGRGPYENYQDRNTASFVGLYHSTVDEQFTPYVRPQENGYKTDVRWMTLQGPDQMVIKFTGQPLFCFSALPFTYDDMKGFKQGGKHLHDLVKKPFVDLNLDYSQMGVGGDDSWGARTHEQYTLPAKEYSYSFTIEASINGEVAK